MGFNTLHKNVFSQLVENRDSHVVWDDIGPGKV